MNVEKRILLSIVLVISAIIVISWQPGFTGYSVTDGNEEILINNVIAGEIAQSSISFNSNNDQSIIVSAEVDGEVKDWIVFANENYVLLPNQERKVNFYVNVPEGTPNGDYYGRIIIMDETKESIIDNQILANYPIEIVVSSDKIESAEVSSLTVYDSEINEDIYFKTYWKNLGNTQEDYKATLEVYDSLGKFLYSKDYEINLLAYEEKEVIGKIDNKLSEGQYYTRMLINNQGESDTFEIVKTGELQVSGELKYVDLSVDKNKVLTKVYFYNNGEKVFYGSIQGNYNEENFETEKQIVLPGEYKEFDYQYNAISGNYILNIQGVSGNIVLDKEEKEILEAKGIDFKSNIYIIFVGVVFVLLVLHYIFTKRAK